MPLSLLHTSARITAFGTYVPEHVLDNHYFASIVDTNDEWITQRTGIKERRQSKPQQYASDLGYQAALNMETAYPGALSGVDAILVATCTPDTFFPSTAAIIQAKLGLTSCAAFDISNACAGFITALQTALGLLAANMHRKVLVIGTETLTKIVDYSDRSTCILFGDGAGAMIVEMDAAEESDAQEPVFLAAYSDTRGDINGTLYRSALADRVGEVEIQDHGYLFQNGREVYKWALQQVPTGTTELLSAAGLTIDELDLFVPHSANMRMIESICDRIGLPLDRTLTSVQQYGNTSAASIPLALQQGIQEGRLQKGQLVLLYGFGGGLSQAALLIRWSL